MMYGVGFADCYSFEEHRHDGDMLWRLLPLLEMMV
jgi:hypothetical protein